MFRPPSLLAPRIVPTAANTSAGQLGLLRPGLSCFVAAARPGYANRPNTSNWRYGDLHPARFSALSAAPFPSCYISSPLPGFTLTLRCPHPTRYAKSAATYIAYQVMAIVPDRARRRSQHADHRLILRAQHNVKKILLHLSNRPPTGCDRNYAGSLGPA